MNVLVVGAGAIGAFYGAKLAQAGAAVTLVCRSDYDAVTAHGIDVASVWGDFHFTPAAVVRSVAEFAQTGGAPTDLILVATKVLPEIDTAAMIRPAVGPGTAVLLLQNGIGIEAPVAAALPGTEILSGLAFACIWRAAPGRIVHQDYGRLAIGRYPSGISPRLKELGALLEAAGVPVTLTDVVQRDRWRKLVWNAPFNPISVLGGGISTREILADDEGATLSRAVMEEVVALAAADGWPLSPDVVQKNLDDTRVMEPYKTSMCLDFENGRPLEVEAILGNAVCAGRRLGVRTPHLNTLYALLRQVDARLRARRG
jgi:2-dehydropantoate 2-reductase